MLAEFMLLLSLFGCYASGFGFALAVSFQNPLLSAISFLFSYALMLYGKVFKDNRGTRLFAISALIGLYSHWLPFALASALFILHAHTKLSKIRGDLVYSSTDRLKMTIIPSSLGILKMFDPDLLTFASAVLSAAALYFYYSGSFASYISMVSAYLLLDAVDGMAARARRASNLGGKLMDSMKDDFFGFGLGLASLWSGWIWPWLGFSILLVQSIQTFVGISIAGKRTVPMKILSPLALLFFRGSNAVVAPFAILDMLIVGLLQLPALIGGGK